MITDPLIDLTENGVFGIQEYQPPVNRLFPWKTDNGIVQNDNSNTSISTISYNIDSLVARPETFTYTYTISNNDWEDFSFVSMRRNDSTNSTIYSFTNSVVDEMIWWMDNDLYTTSSSSLNRISLSMKKEKTPLVDIFGRPIDKKKEHGRSTHICPICGRVDDYIWSGHRRCDCQNYKNENPICWQPREKEIERQKNSQEERQIPWAIEEEIQASKKRSGKHRFRRFFGDDSADRREDLLDRICWLNREKSYFGIGGKVDWVGIEERWEEREEEIAQILTGNTVEIQDVTI